MLLVTILQVLDREIERLHKLRDILAPLQSPFVPLPSADPRPEPDSPLVPEPILIRLPPKREPRRRVPQSRPVTEIPRALSANIPSAPVVVPRAVALPQPYSQPEPPAAAQPGSFGAMVRAAERQLGT